MSTIEFVTIAAGIVTGLIIRMILDWRNPKKQFAALEVFLDRKSHAIARYRLKTKPTLPPR